MTLTDELLTLGTSTLFEAAGVQIALDPDIRPAWQGAAVAGAAYPLRCAPHDNLALQLAVERAPSGSVLMVDGRGSVAGFWGEVLTVAAEAAGIAGIVIDGGVRDVAALRARGFPAFSRYITVRGTVKASAPIVGGSIVLAGVGIAPGDMVVADEDGVICIPQLRLEPVLEKARARAAKEAAMMDKLRAGEKMIDLLGLRELRHRY